MGARCTRLEMAAFELVIDGVCCLDGAVVARRAVAGWMLRPSKKSRDALLGACRQANGQVRGQLLVSWRQPCQKLDGFAF